MSKGWDLRILSWNICELRGDLPALIEATQDLDADVLLIQEAPRFVLPQARLDWFARRIDRQILVGGRFGRGLAILARPEVARQVIRRGMHPVSQQITDRYATYPRGVAAVRLSVPGGGAVAVGSRTGSRTAVAHGSPASRTAAWARAWMPCSTTRSCPCSSSRSRR